MTKQEKTKLREQFDKIQGDLSAMVTLVHDTETDDAAFDLVRHIHGAISRLELADEYLDEVETL